jgi:putative tryptophan/tyrosine transport system substrate-binding protein
MNRRSSPAAETTRAAVLRLCVLWLGLALLAASGAAMAADPPAKVARIGFVGLGPVFGRLPNHRAFLDGMRDNGLVEGRDFVMAFRSLGGDVGKIAERSAELVRLPVDLMLVAVCGEWLDAPRLTHTIPIVVMTCNEDLVATGVVQSLNRPGGNVTGLSKLTPELAAKRLELLRDVVPAARRIAVLWNPSYSAFTQDWRELRAAAQRFGITLESVEFSGAADLDAAFVAIARLQVDALMTFSDAATYAFSKRLANLAVAARLPSVFAFREIPDSGGLMSYGPSIPGMSRRAATYVARILRGTPPAELPIELPTRFELVVNQKAAQALGIKVPNSVLLRADEVISP